MFSFFLSFFSFPLSLSLSLFFILCWHTECPVKRKFSQINLNNVSRVTFVQFLYSYDLLYFIENVLTKPAINVSSFIK